jgi:hypothetical protein
MLFAEIVYLNDGQIIKGSIVREDKTHITVKTKFLTRKIVRKNITRILFGQREMEKVYILFKDESILEGFLVDQDNKKVIFRPGKKTATEKIYEKTNIVQISSTPIYLFKPRVSARFGYFIPFVSGKSNLNAAPVFLAAYDILFPWPKGSRIIFEAGVSRMESDTNKNLFLQTIPISAQFLYEIPVLKGIQLFNKDAKFSASTAKHLTKLWLKNRAGFGTVWSNFETGEGEKYSGLHYMFLFGLGVSYPVFTPNVRVAFDTDYVIMKDSKKTQHNLWFTLGGTYKY